MSQKVYEIGGAKYCQPVMNIEQIKAFLKLLKELGIGQIINAGQLDFDAIFEQIITHDKIELFLAIVLVKAPEGKFEKNNYDQNLQIFSAGDGNLLAEVMEDFLERNEPWFTRLSKQMDKMKAPASAAVATAAN